MHGKNKTLKSTHLICKGSRRWDKPGSLFMEADEAFRDTEADAWATIGCASSGETRTPHTQVIRLFVWLISHHSAVILSQNKSATSNQPAVLFSQNKSAPATSQTNRLPIGSARSASPSLAPWTWPHGPAAWPYSASALGGRRFHGAAHHSIGVLLCREDGATMDSGPWTPARS
jgi:hypothetical protein